MRTAVIGVGALLVGAGSTLFVVLGMPRGREIAVVRSDRRVLDAAIEKARVADGLISFSAQFNPAVVSVGRTTHMIFTFEGGVEPVSGLTVEHDGALPEVVANSAKPDGDNFGTNVRVHTVASLLDRKIDVLARETTATSFSFAPQYAGRYVVRLYPAVRGERLKAANGADIVATAILSVDQAHSPSDEQHDREAFADLYERELLRARANPDGVSANGRTLHVQIWRCSRQFVYDFANGTMGDQAHSVGFTRVECSNGAQSWWQDL